MKHNIYKIFYFILILLLLLSCKPKETVQETNNEIFIDSEKLCGYWALDPDTVDAEGNLRRTCYVLEKKDTKDYYNNYIGVISIYYYGSSDEYDIIKIEKVDENEYILDLGITYGISGGTIPIIDYGKLRMVFTNRDTAFFELISRDDDRWGFYILDFLGKNFPLYRAVIDNSMETKDYYGIDQTFIAYTVIKDNLPLYSNRSGEEGKIITYLNKGDKVQLIRDNIISNRLHHEYRLLTGDDITGAEVFVKPSNDESGITFFNFLEKEDENE